MAVAILFGVHSVGDTFGANDIGYVDLARHIRLGDGFLAGDPPMESIRRGPGYPAFLAGSFIVDGADSGLASIVAQAALDAVVAVLVFALARTVFGVTQMVSTIGGLFYALDPYQGFTAAGLQTQTLFTFLLTAGVAVLAVGFKRNPMAYGAAGGILLGLAALTRAIALGFIAFLIGLLIIRWLLDPRRRSALAPVLLGVAAAAVILPWTVRNFRVTGELVPIQEGAGEVFYVTTFTEWDQKNEAELWPRFFADPIVVEATSGRLPPNERDALMFRAGLENIRRDSVGYVRSRLANYPWLFVYGGDFVTTHPVALGDLARQGDLLGLARKLGYALIFYIVPLALAVVGVLHRRWRSWPTMLVGSFWVYNAVLETVLWVEPAYYAPSVPFLAVWATAGLATLADSKHKAEQAQADPRPIRDDRRQEPSG